jgi:hypothetical protein
VEITAPMAGQLTEVSPAKAANAPQGLFLSLLAFRPAYHLGDSANFDSAKPNCFRCWSKGFRLERAGQQPQVRAN